MPDDRHTATDAAGAASVPGPASSTPPPPPPSSDAGGPTPPEQPTGTPRVDILREAVDLGQQGANALRLWLIGNDMPTDHMWPIRIDWPARTIDYWPALPETVTDRTSLDPTRVPLKRVPLTPLWHILADRGALWCANPTHQAPDGAQCPHRVDARGEHTTHIEDHRFDRVHPTLVPAGRVTSYPNTEQRPDPHTQLEQLVRRALERAAPDCDHPDPGGPIYEPTRGCAQCGAAAVLELFHTADAIHHLQRRALEQQHGQTDSDRQVGYWMAGHGYVPAGDPRANLRFGGTWPTD